MRTAPRGFFLLLSLLAITGLLSLAMVGLGRSSLELAAATRAVTTQQAFHLAEAGIDDALAAFTGSGAGFALSDGWASESGGPCATACQKSLPLIFPATTTITIDDIRAEEPTITVTSLVKGARQQLAAKVRRQSSVFDYVVSGTTLNLNGGATIGDPFNRQGLIHLDGPPDSTGDLAMSNANRIWIAEIDFFNPTNLSPATLCSRCNPTDPDNLANIIQVDAFNWNAPQASALKLDLHPYYDAARAQELAEPGQHLVPKNTTKTFSSAVDGIIYVECGGGVTFEGAVTLKGTIVHEGCGGDITITAKGKVGGQLTIDSLSDNKFGKSLAPGLAIIGAPNLQWGSKTSIDIKGFVMHQGPGSTFATSGTIQGGLIGTNESWIRDTYPQLKDQDGPGSYPVITWPLFRVSIDGGTALIFKTLPQPPPGLQGSTRPAILLWQSR